MKEMEFDQVCLCGGWGRSEVDAGACKICLLLLGMMGVAGSWKLVCKIYLSSLGSAWSEVMSTPPTFF